MGGAPSGRTAGGTADHTAKADDLLDLLRQTAIKRAAVMEISEAEVNRHLATTLTGKVGKMLGKWTAFDGARIDLEPDRARLFLVWKLKGFTRTASVDLAIAVMRTTSTSSCSAVPTAISTCRAA
jgi:hypothetical protein